MTHQAKIKQEFSNRLDLESRISMVMAAHSAHGHVSRKRLMSMYGITQIQAGSLMRDFIHAHANDLEWNAHHSHYEYAVKKR